MKCITSSVVGLLLSILLAMASPTDAQISNVSTFSLDNNTSSTLSSNELSQSTILNVVFGGWNLSWQRVRNIAKDPIVSWGAVRDTSGNWVQGEVWLIVAKKDEFIYFHLTDTPNTAKDTTAYNGYTVKSKAVMTLQFYSFGFGSGVPIIGNETDTFLVMTIELWAHSAFVDGEIARLDVHTGAELAYLVHLYDEVQCYGFSSSGARSSIAIQYFAPDGTELIEPFSQSWYESASSSSSSTTTCAAVGDDVAELLHGLADAGQSVNSTFTPAYAVGLWMSPLVSKKSPLFALYGLTLLSSSLGAQAMQSLVHQVGAPVAGSLAEGACEAVSTGNAFPVLPPIELAVDVDDVVFASEAQLVCDRYESVPTGSSARETDDGGVEVTGHSEVQCVEWHYEVSR